MAKERLFLLRLFISFLQRSKPFPSKNYFHDPYSGKTCGRLTYIVEGKTDMRHKYVISLGNYGKKLLIREYADIDKNQKKQAPEMQVKNKYSFLYEETYESETIVSSIAKGENSLIASLRTRNMFPTRPLAIKLAESVRTLYKSSKGETVELFFDDIDMMPV
ncbi:MAG: hypothetical protein K9K88_18990 [Desulfobacterales bacterium]|nr:hypothetical protein [Desulfobacterales bacterium]